MSRDNDTIFEPRIYRHYGQGDRFVAFRVTVSQSDLFIKARMVLVNEATRLTRESRSRVESAITRRKDFLTSLVPIAEHPGDSPLASRMIAAGRKAGTGPMAAVAGAVADYVGRGLLEWSLEVIVENGGDIFLKVDHPIKVGLFAGKSPFSNRIGIRIKPIGIPRAVCTSSGTVGHSLSLGKADAATVLSRDAILADAAATAMGNMILETENLKKAVEWAMNIPGVDGALAVRGDKIAVMGDVELVSLGDE
ncbi:MAG: UPF0280 family protein [Pseudomonadota bacterium]